MSEPKPKVEPKNIEEPSDRGELSQEGFGDYDKNFQPTKVEIDEEDSEESDED
ncbi:hypothetical protein BH23CHL5_BH23CHL5_16070 [soil metagenome]